MAELDPSIILKAGNINDPQQMLTLKSMAQQIDQRTQAAQSQNALKKLLSQPGAIGPDGLPTAAVTGQMSAAGDIDTAVQVSNARTTQELKAEEGRDKHQKRIMELQHDATLGALNAYSDATDKGPEAAERAKQEYWSQFWDTNRKQFGLSDAEMPHQTNPSIDFLKNTARSYDDYRKSEEAKATQKERDRHDLQMENLRAQHDGMNGGKFQKNIEEIEIPDGKGGTKKVAAQQGADGGWYSADQFRTPYPAPTRIAKPMDVTGRENQTNQRILQDMADATKDIGNAMALPMSVSTGLFGGRKQGGSLFSAAKEVLINEVTPQDVQDFQTAMVGVGRAIAGMQTQGMQVSDALLNRMDKMDLKEGDTYLTKMRKMATLRQHVDNAMEVFLANPRVGDDQKNLAKELMGELHQAVPFTVPDVTKLENSKNPQMSMTEVASQHFKNAGVKPVADKFTGVPSSGGHFEGEIQVKHDSSGKVTSGRKWQGGKWVSYVPK